MSAPSAKKKKIETGDLKNFRQLKVFCKELKKAFGDVGVSPTWTDSRRKLSLVDYYCLYLFALLNPVVDSMRGGCAISHIKKVQQRVCSRPVSLGSFSEAQHLVDLEVLERVLESLWKRVPDTGDPQLLKGRSFKIVDSSVWRVCQRLQWALWRPVTGGGNTTSDAAVRMHTIFDLSKGAPQQAVLTKAKMCERKVWKELAEAGNIYIGDRYYSYDYTLLEHMIQRRIGFIVRARVDTQWVLEREIALSPEDLKQGVQWSGWVRLGKGGKGPRVRVVRISGEKEPILILTTLSEEDFSAGEIRALYKNRWEIEFFFRWLKHVLQNRQWFCESPNGLQVQVYLALVAAMLLMLVTGKRPNKRAMEIIQHYFQGLVADAELAGLLKRFVK